MLRSLNARAVGRMAVSRRRGGLHRILTLLLGALLVLPSRPLRASADDSAVSLPTGVALVNEVAGQVQALAGDGTTLYVGAGPRVDLFDVSRPAQPRPIGATPILSGVVQQLAVRGTLLVTISQTNPYASAPASLDTFDLRDPAHPARLGGVAMQGAPAALALGDGFAAVVLDAPLGGGRIALVDLRHPAAPAIASTLPVPMASTAPVLGSAPFALAAAGATLYVAAGGTLQVISLADLAHPTVVGKTTLPSPWAARPTDRKAFVSQGVLYLLEGLAQEGGAGQGALRSVDVSDPTHPRLLDTLGNLPYPTGGMTRDGRLVYVGARTILDAVDVADPAHLRSLGAVDLGAAPTGDSRTAEEVAAAGPGLAVQTAGYTGAISLFDVADPARPRPAGALDTLKSLGPILRDGQSLYVGNDLFNLSVFSLGDPARPEQVGRLPVPGGIQAMAVARPYLYLGGGPPDFRDPAIFGRLTVVDIADPSHPAATATLDLPGRPSSLAGAGTRLYAAASPNCAARDGYGGGFYVFDISTPSAPMQTAFVPLKERCNSVIEVTAIGATAYVTTLEDTRTSVRHIIDVTDERHPAELSATPVPLFPEQALSGHYLYSGTGGSGKASTLTVEDVSDPAHPRQVSSVVSPVSLGVLTLDGTTLASSSPPDQTVVFDLSNPRQPVLAGVYHQLGSNNLAMDHSYLYVGDLLSGGLWVLQRLPARAGAPVPASALPHDGRYFPETGFRIANDAFWQFFTAVGGSAVLGYPVSRAFRLGGFTVQIFQRQVLQQFPDGSVHLLNLLDAPLLPYTGFGGTPVPPVDRALIAGAPDPTDRPAMLAWVRQHAPDAYDGQPVDFAQAFLHPGATLLAPQPNQAAAVAPAVALALWGLPTSAPTVVRGHPNLIALRWQRGAMLYDATCHCTRDLFVGDDFKALLTGQRLPTDLAREAVNSPYAGQYCPGAAAWLCRPNQVFESDLTAAFAPG